MSASRRALLCWTAGVSPAPVVRELGLPLGPGGRIEVDADHARGGHDNVWAIGDAAAVPDPAKRRQAPPPAHRPARAPPGSAWWPRTSPPRSAAARPQPFRYQTLGVFVDMGQHKAVATMLGVRLRGFPAWFAARTYHLAMMPGLARKVRLAADWTVGLFFGRASAELGQLGHPPVLSGDAPKSAARDPVSVLSFREGRAATCGRLRAGRGRPGRVRARSAGCCPSSTSARPTTCDDALGAPAAAARVHRRPSRRRVRGLRGRRRAGRLRARRPLRRDGRADRAVGRAVARGAGSRGGPARALLARVARPRSWAASWSAIGRPADLTLYTDFGVMPVSGHWHMRHRTRGVHRAPLPGDRRAAEPTVHALTPDARGRGVEAAGAARHRPRAPAAARVLRPHAHLPGHRRRTGAATGLCWVSSEGEIGPAVGEEPAPPGAGGARGARPRRQVAGAGERQRLLHDRLAGGCSTACAGSASASTGRAG